MAKLSDARVKPGLEIAPCLACHSALCALALLSVTGVFGARADAAPNLIVNNVSMTESAVHPGDSVHITWRVRNVGTTVATGTWRDRFYLSTDNLVGDDQILDSYGYLASLPPYEMATLHFSVGIPYGIPLTDYWIVVKTDADNALTESDETDNTAVVGPLKVTLPNLVVNNVSISRAPANPGDHVTVTYQTQNISADVDAVGTWADEIWLVYENPAIPDTLLYHYGFFADVNPGEHYQHSFSVYIPTHIWCGKCWLVVRTDVGRKISETEEMDNSAWLGPFTLNGDLPPPPALSLVSWPLFIIIGLLGAMASQRLIAST